MDDFILPCLSSTPSVGNSKMKEGSTAVFGFDIRVLLYNGMFRGQKKGLWVLLNSCHFASNYRENSPALVLFPVFWPNAFLDQMGSHSWIPSRIVRIIVWVTKFTLSLPYWLNGLKPLKKKKNKFFETSHSPLIHLVLTISIDGFALKSSISAEKASQLVHWQLVGVSEACEPYTSLSFSESSKRILEVFQPIETFLRERDCVHFSVTDFLPSQSRVCVTQPLKACSLLSLKVAFYTRFCLAKWTKTRVFI